MFVFNPQICQVLLMGSLAGLATTAGAALVMLIGKPGENILALLLATAGGVMLSVVFIDLMPTAWSNGPPWQVAAGLIAGVLLMNTAISSLSRRKSSFSTRRQRLKNTGLLIAMGIALHDIPEGMAIAVGHEATDRLGILIALAIALHNLPEGMATAVPLRMAEIRWHKVLLLSLGIAVMTPVGSALGILAITFVSGTLTLFLSLAAGSMGFLVFKELLPTSRERHPNWSRLGVALGFASFSLLSLTF